MVVCIDAGKPHRRYRGELLENGRIYEVLQIYHKKFTCGYCKEKPASRISVPGVKGVCPARFRPIKKPNIEELRKTVENVRVKEPVS